MLRAIRNRMHLTPTTVIATVALVFAMSGGAYAANKYLITSTKQISPKVLKSLKGANGKNGLNGANGTNGATGPAGPSGAPGAKGENGAAGAGGAQGPAGPQGPAGAPGAKGEIGAKGENGTIGFTKTLPSGETETGAWAVSATGEGLVLDPISFNIPLAKALDETNVHFVEENGNGSTCPGKATAPTALPGNLCVYKQSSIINVEFTAIIGTGLGGAGSTTGAVLEFQAGAEAPRFAAGSWAVTAEIETK